MKVCPRCQKTYTDDNLNFCLDDGSTLTAARAQPAPDPVYVNQTRPASSNPSQQQGAPGSWGSAPQQQQFSMQPAKKSSKTWIWVLGILAVVVLVCGGGIVGFFAWVASQADKTTANYRKTADTSPSPRSSSSPTSNPADRTDLKVVDLSKLEKDSDDVTAEFNGTELIMAPRKKGFYYVMIDGDAAYDKGNVTVTVRNTEDADSANGYGLIFHSSIIVLMNDYAFLIDAKKKRYRVITHLIKKENLLVGWKNSSKIKGGTEENVLEARDVGDNIELYINGDLVETIKNAKGVVAAGAPGIYSGDPIKVAFSKLEVRK